jgi:polysaccharide export outer membrane protein
MILFKGVRGCAQIWATGAVLLHFTLTPAFADYLVARGDVLELTVIGAQDSAGQHYRLAIDTDGEVALPLLGRIEAAGLSLSKLRSRLYDAMVTRKLFSNPDITVEVVQYRPFYISGDIAKPGAYPYSPGITVRQAAAVAGGYDYMHLASRNLYAEAAEVRGEYKTLWVELVSQEARVAELQAELSDKTALDVERLHAAAVRPDVRSEIVTLEDEKLKTNQVDYQNERTSLSRVVAVTQEQLSALHQQREQEASGIQQQARNVAQARELLQKGLSNSARVEEEEREMTFSQSRLLEVEARIAQARRDLEEYNRKLQKSSDERRALLLLQAQEAVTQLEKTRVRLEAVGEKLLYTAAAGLDRLQGGEHAPQVVIYRESEEHQQRIAADESTKLLPGDSVEIIATPEFPVLPMTPPIAQEPRRPESP